MKIIITEHDKEKELELTLILDDAGKNSLTIKCKEEKTAQLIQSRKALFKQDLVGGITWSLLFLIVLFIHYPKFMRTKQEK